MGTSTAPTLAPPACPLKAKTTVVAKTASSPDGDWSNVGPKPSPTVSKRSPAKSGEPVISSANTTAFPTTLLVSVNPAWSACMGDSGGPLVCNNGSGAFDVIGVDQGMVDKRNQGASSWKAANTSNKQQTANYDFHPASSCVDLRDGFPEVPMY